MPPTRTKQSGEAVSHKAKGKRRQNQEDHVPGVQKIKAALRQTRRLLAKEKLAADVRIETERRLRSLEEDLAQAETSKKERAFAIRYHKVKFFERQKVVRKIEQIKKQLSTTLDDPALEQELFAQRVNLNYILHYPKTSKYISLFPPESRNGESAQETVNAKTNQEREDLKDQMRKAMAAGELPTQPDAQFHPEDQTAKKKTVSSTPKSSKRAKKHLERNTAISKKDDFFDDDASGEDDDSS